MDKIEQKLIDMGYQLPKPRVGSKIVPAKVVGNLVFVSGHGCSDEDGNLKYRGRVGTDVSLEEAYEAAKLCAINALGGLKAVIGNLERVDEIVKVLGFVNSDEDFHRQPEVMHGFTDLLVELFGPEKGIHARSAIGTSNLPKNQPVEVEMIVTLKDA
ncbi:MAG: RidA family protein [Firmicutes bacterium]|jgi:enamine deaminase RidA (YjgF/YER057c/UK114 family)|nr:RidA family protein [Bacillota bacterium]